MIRVKLLAIGGDPQDMLALRETLNRHLPGSRVIIVSTDGQALKLAAQERPDCVLIGQRTTKAEGLKLCRGLKAQASTANAYIILSAAREDARWALSQGLAAGADDLVFGPERDLQILTSLSTAVRLRRERKPSADSAASGRELEAMRDGKSRLRELVELLPEIIFEMDLKGNVRFANANAFAITGYTQADLDRGLNVTELLSAGSRRRPKADLREFLAGRRSGPFDYVVRRKNGSSFPVAVYANPIIVAGRPAGVRGIATDVTERKRSEAKLFEYQQRLQQLASELSLAEERQRRHIATALHDRVGQHLAASNLKLQLLKNSRLSESCAKLVNEIIALNKRVTHDIRTVTFELCPPLLYEVGLVAAVERLLIRFQSEHGIACKLHNAWQSLEPEVELRGLLFQVISELLRNAANHADAKRVNVTFAANAEGLLTIVVADDGKGFDVSKIESAHSNEAGGFGLLNIRARVRHLGGRMKIESGIGRGTRVALILPVSERTNVHDGVRT